MDSHTVREVGTTARAWWTLLAVALGIMVVQIDGTVVSVANPAIAADLGAGPQGIAWVTTGYLLVFAALLIPAGRLADRMGRRRTFLVGVGGFSLASLACGLAGSVEVLIAARVGQAVFAALLGPSGLALVRAAFPADRLPRALGVFGAVTAAALAGGPMLGGLLVEYAGWPWVFFVNLPFGLVGVVVGLAVLRESRQESPGRLDLAGTVALTLAMLGVVGGIIGAQDAGWTSWTTLGSLLVGIGALIAFVAIESRVAHPLVPLSLFRDRSFSAGCALMVLTMLVFFAILFYLTFFLQGVQGRSALLTGVALLPLTAVFTVVSPLAGWATRALGSPGTLLLGAASTAASLGLLLTLTPSSGAGLLVPALLLAGFGAGFTLVPGIAAIIGNAPLEHAGVASGLQQSAQQLGSTLGVAVFGSLLAEVVTARFPTAAGAPLGTDPAVVRSVALGFDPAARAALQERIGPGPLLDAVTRAAHETFVQGLDAVFTVALVATGLVAVLSLLVKDPAPEPEPGPEAAVADTVHPAASRLRP